MMMFRPLATLVLATGTFLAVSLALQVPSTPNRERVAQSTALYSSSSSNLDRKQILTFLGGSAAASWFTPLVSNAGDDSDLMSTMFNPDGSLKDAEADIEAKFRAVDFTFNGSANKLALNVDGVNDPSTSKGDIKLSYELPLKWDMSASKLYFDRSEGVNAQACDKIIVYQAPGTVSIDRLEKATRVGIAKSLDVPDGDLQSLATADLINGRSVAKDGQRYFEFDMAVAPKTCDKSKEDLGLGFCPYDSIYLLSATVFDDRLYVLAMESNKDEWKRASADLKRVRSSFKVEH